VVSEPRTCTGTNRHGGRCRRIPEKGHLVCLHHGAKDPDQLAAARRRLLAAADTTADRLVELLDASDEHVQLRAAAAILDRVGLGPSSTKVNVDGGRVRYELEGVDLDQL
jgi:hypothetical protein